jgi:hypothetical protein
VCVSLLEDLCVQESSSTSGVKESFSGSTR